MGRYTYCFVFSVILVAVKAQDFTGLENSVRNTNICGVCICRYGTVNCKDQKLNSFFSLDEWGDITDIEPKKVDLSDNALTAVTPLADLPVEELDLSNNNIDFIENSSFRYLTGLRVLDLSNNRLTSKLSPHVFEGRYSPEEYEALSSMRVLNLANNDFYSLHQDLFEHLPELTELDLSGNPLTRIDHVTLIAISSLPMLKELSLRSCQLSEIPDNFLHTPRYLERLDLSNNQLTMVPQELKKAMNLVYLNLDQNPIEELDMNKEDALGFPTVRKLQELHMCNMPVLRRIGTGALAGLENLVKLHLSSNPKLTEIDPKSLARPDDFGETYDWPIIKELYISSNNLSEVDPHLLDRWDLVEKLNVTDNPYLCDCSTHWMVDVLVTIVEHKKINDSENMVCQEPIEMRGYTMKHLHDIHHTMGCVYKDSNKPERGAAIPLGALDTLSKALDVAKETGNCRVYCKDQKLDKFFSLDDCQELIEMLTMSCVTATAEGDGAILLGTLLLGTLIGVLLAVPVMLSLMLLWRRDCCGWLGPQDLSSYKRAPADDNYKKTEI